MKLKPFSLAVLFILFGCDSDDAEPIVDVAISNGKLQCQENALPLETTKGYLLEAAVDVIAEYCGIENSPVVTECGATENQIHIFTINEKGLNKAENIGFIEASSLEDGYKIVDCEDL